jgi:para-aminobenzoate synthetase component 1
LQRNKAVYELTAEAYKSIKQMMLGWSQQFSILLFVDSNEYASAYGRYECLLAVAGKNAPIATNLRALQALHDQHKDWLFGHIAYEYKDELYNMLSSKHTVQLDIPQFHFFLPETVCYISTDRDTLTIETELFSPDDIYAAIINYELLTDNALPPVAWNYTTTRDEYIKTITQLKEHIVNGDCYEVNYCTGGFAAGVAVDPLHLFSALNRLSPAPFAACYKLGDVHMACASPERYLYKKGSTLMAQPIKGTARRDTNPVKDEQLKADLYADLKERAENVMIVDLMRNDLARCSEVGSVRVDELFGIYTFPQVHQMISTVSSIMRADMNFTDALRYSFPMGSMTGAPKIKVMQLIEEYEHSRRELFSGTVGYITPDGDFDFNVLIRSLFYNATTKFLSYHTGGAITADSVPEKEYEEMRLKAWALERIFGRGLS